MDSTTYAEICCELKRAEEFAWKAIMGKQGDAELAHEFVRRALELARKAADAPACQGPECADAVPYKGTGRPQRYCSRRCRDRARYQEQRQRTAT